MSSCNLTYIGMLKVFNQVSSHGAEDLQKVTKIAKDRVEKYGT